MRILVCSFLLFLSQSALAERFHYDNHGETGFESRPAMTIVIDTEHNTAMLASELLAIDPCSDQMLSPCFFHPEFYFSAPRHQTAVGTKWENNDVSYEIVSEFNTQIFGRTYCGIVIRSRKEGSIMLEFFYSREDGLLAIIEYSEDGEQSGLYMLREAAGFGARP